MNKHVKNQLKAQAHALKPVIIIGAKGVTKPLIEETDCALKAHELIKVKVNGEDKNDRTEIATHLCGALQAELIQIIGHIAIIYRKKEEE